MVFELGCSTDEITQCDTENQKGGHPGREKRQVGDMSNAVDEEKEARSVLPISVKTEIWCTANLREWQHIFGLRCAKKAHPQIRALMIEALEIFADEVPPMFQALWEKFKK